MTEYPNVPNVAGVPQLPRSPNFPPTAQAVLGFLEGKLWQAIIGYPDWLIFSQSYFITAPKKGFVDRLKSSFDGIGVGGFTIGGSKVNPYADSVLIYDFEADSKLGSFPVQSAPNSTSQSGFASYSKVKSPNDLVITITKGGKTEDRAALMATLEAAQNSIELFTIITPEKTHESMNLYNYNTRREAKDGAHLLTIELSFQEVRQVAPMYETVQVTENAQKKEDQPSVATGIKAPEQASPSLLKQIGGGISDVLKGWTK